MGLFDKLKNKNKHEQPASTKSGIVEPTELASGIRYRDVEVIIDFNVAESKAHIHDDFAVLMDEGIEKIIKERFVPWLKGDQFPDKEDELVYDGLNLTEILYSYGRIIAKYSPTGKDDFFGKFEFLFDSGSAYTDNMLEAVAMTVFVNDGEIVKVSGYDV